MASKFNGRQVFSSRYGLQRQRIAEGI